MVHDGVIDYSSILAFSLKSDGSPVILCRTAPTSKKVMVRGRPIQQLVLGDIQAYNINDALSATGTLVVNQGTSPWTVRPDQSNADNTANSALKAPVLNARANASVPAWTESFQVPLSVDLSGRLRSLSFVSVASTFAGNASYTPARDAILKSAVAVTDNGVGGRLVTIGGNNLSSKSVAASSTGDLLDREIAVPAGVAIALSSNRAGDTVLFSLIMVA